MMDTQRLPFSHLRILDLTRARSGPTAARQFADWGADVIMIESPDGGDELTGGRHSPDFQNLHRNKRSILLDLKDEGDRVVFLDLVRSADVLLENYRPDVKQRLGIDYETLHAVNPRLVYGSISGFGQDGPNAMRPGIDQIAQGYAGLMSVTGIPGQGPVRAGYAVTDSVAGLYCALGVMTALIDREISGVGRWVRTSLLEAGIALLDFQAARYLAEGVVPGQEGNQHPTGVPMGMFATADGYVNIGAATSATFAKFARVVGRTEWLEDPRFADASARYQSRDALREEIGHALARRTSAEWIADLADEGVPCGPVYGLDEVFADQQVQHLGMTRNATSATRGAQILVSQPIQISGIPFVVRTSAPEAGSDGDAVISALRSGGHS